MTSLFHGSALCQVDANGAVQLPAFLAEAGSGSELLVSKHNVDGCLVAYDREHLEVLRARAETRRVIDESRGEDARDHYRRMRRTFGIVEKMPAEAGVIHIPAAMRHLGRIDRLALFVGAGDSFEIWNPALAIENEDEQFRDLAVFRLKAGGDAGSIVGVS